MATLPLSGTSSRFGDARQVHTRVGLNYADGKLRFYVTEREWPSGSRVVIIRCRATSMASPT